jgi:hypothetical protein
VACFAVGAVQGFDVDRQRPDYDAIARHIAETGRGGEPVVNQRDLSPGAPDSLDVAFAQLPESERHPIIRLGDPPLDAILARPPFADVPEAPGEQVAREAARRAGDGMLFLILPTRASRQDLERARGTHTTSTSDSPILVKLAAFMGALPKRFELVDTYTTTGFSDGTVYSYAAR